MSHVTDIILLTFIEEDIAPVQEYLQEHYHRELIEVSDYAGGDKAMQCEVWVAAINHFQIETFVRHLRSLDWEHPEYVQLLMKDEHDEQFTAYQITAPWRVL